MAPKLGARMRSVAASLIFVAAGCINNAFTSPDDLDPEVLPEWAIGQAGAECFVGDKAYHVHPTGFTWVREPDVFNCGSVRANGCYSQSSHRIRWNEKTPTVIRHETGHAILHTLKHKCASDYEHRDICNPRVVCGWNGEAK